MVKRIPGWITGAFLLALCLLVIYGSGCKEGNNSTPISMTLSGIQATSGTLDEYSGTFSISGYVKNNDVPVVNLPVELFVGDKQVANPVQTAGNGQFIFSNLAAALYTLRIGHGSATFTEMLYPVYITSDGSQSPSDLVVPIELQNPTVIPASGTIEAYVIDASTNNPILLATASLSMYSGGVWVPQNKSTLTDGSGYFYFSGVLPGLYTLNVNKTGYASMAYPVNIQSTGAMSPSKPKIPLTFISAVPTITGTLSGYAKDLSGNVIPEITITVKNSKTGIQVTGSPRITTTQGKFTFDGLPVGEYTITASGAGYTSVTRTSYIRTDGTSDPESTDLILAPITRITGSLVGYVKLENDTPLPEIIITVTDINTGLTIAGSPRKTTTEGKYIFESVPVGDYTVSASGTGYSTATRTCYIKSDGSADPVTTQIVLTRLTELRGTITGYARLDITNAVLPEITVTAKNVGTGQFVSGSPRKTTSEGKYSFYDLIPGEYTITASGTGYTEVTRTCYIKTDGTADPVSTDLILSYSMQSSMIEAYVVDAATNAGVNLATIKLFKYVGGIWDDLGKTTLSNGSGYFAFSDVNPGLYRVTISKSDYVDRDFAITIREDGTKDPAMPKIILTPVAQAVVGNVVGTVKLDTTGQVLPEIYVSLKNSSNAHVTGSPLKTTADGKFGFYGLVPGTYTLNASGTSFTSVTRTCYILSNGTTDPSSTILTLSRDPATGNIIGYVKYGTTPLPEISVRILDSTDTPLASSPFITTQDGKFAANDLGAGVYTISIDDPKYAPATRTVYIASNGTVDPATTNISLTKVTGTLSGYVRNSSTNAALAEVWVSVKGSDGQNAASPMLTTAEGRYYFSNLLPDTYTLNASAPGYLTATRTVYIREDGTTDPTTTTLFITPDPSVVGTIVGYVRLASTSAALPEIDVKLYKGLVQVGNDIRTTSEGKFLFENLQPDTYTITVPGTVSGGPGQTYYEVTRTCYIRSNGTSDPTQTTIPLVDKP